MSVMPGLLILDRYTASFSDQMAPTLIGHIRLVL